MKYLPILTLPLAAFFLLVAITTIRSHKANSKELRLDPDLCYELGLELHASVDEGLLTQDQASGILSRCYRDFVHRPAQPTR